MSDLVERLRALGGCNRFDVMHYCPNCDRSIDGEMLDEAAARISELEAELAEARAQLTMRTTATFTQAKE